MLILLTLLAAVSAALTIIAQYRTAQRLEYVFKPLTMAWIILIALLANDPLPIAYHVLIVAGLLASLAGDVFLMLPSDKFVHGLVSFLIAHILYITAFTVESGGATPIWYIIPFVAYGAIMLRWLWPHLGAMKRPVIVYVGIILIMAWQAANRWLVTDQRSALLALIGAYLFVTSDSALAVERFRGTWRSAPFWVLSTYFTAQWLFALSIYGHL